MTPVEIWSDGFPYRAVSWDIDGTLYSLGMFKFQLGVRRFADLKVWIAMENVRKAIRREGAHDPDMHARIVREIAERVGWSEEKTARKIEEMLDKDWPWLLGHTRLSRGVREALDVLETAQIPMVLNSDYPGVLKAKGLGLDVGRFRGVIDATETGFLKPAPAPFEEAARVLGVEPSEVLHVGDSWELDVLGAHRAGMATALVGKGKRPKGLDPSVVLPEPTVRFRSVAVLAKAFEKAFATHTSA